MSTFNQVMSFFLDVTGQPMPAVFFTSRRSTNAVGVIGGTQGDKVLLKLYLCVPTGTMQQEHALLTANGPIVWALFSAIGTGSLLSITSAWELVEDETGLHYEGLLDLDTIECRNILTGTATSKALRLDVEFQAPGNAKRITFSRDFTLYRQTYTGNETEPVPATPAYPPPGDIPSRAEIQQLQLMLRKLALGGQSWYNAVTGKWHKVFLTGEAGHETYAIDPAGYDSPELIPDVSDPLSWEVTYNEGDAGNGVQPVHLGDATMDSVGWINPGAQFSVGSHGRAVLVEILQAGESEGVEYPVLLLRPLPPWTGGNIAGGERVTLMSNAGIQGEQGEQGDQGDPGDTGPANNLTVGTVTTLPAGSAATATLTGASPNQTLNLGLPRGATGENGTTADTSRIVALEEVRRPRGGVRVSSLAGTANTVGYGLGPIALPPDGVTLAFDLRFDPLSPTTWTAAETGFVSGTNSESGVFGQFYLMMSGNQPGGNLQVANYNSSGGNKWENILPAGAIQARTAHRLAVRIVGKTLDAYLDGAFLQTTALSYALADVRGLLGGYLRTSQPRMDMRSVAIFDYALSAGEVTDYFRSGTAASDLAPTATIGTGWVNSGGATAWPSFASASAADCTVSNTSTGGHLAYFPVAAAVGTRLRIAGHAVSTGTPYYALKSAVGSPLLGYRLIAGSNVTEQTSGKSWRVTADGAWWVEIEVLEPCTMFCVIAGALAASGVALTEFLLRQQRCLLNLTPDSAGSGGDWADCSPARNHARKGTAAAVNALDGRPQTIAIPVTWPSTSIPPASEAPVLLTAAEAAAIGSTATTDRFTWMPATALPTGLAVKEVRCTSASNVSVLVRNLTGAAISTGAHTGTLFQIIP